MAAEADWLNERREVMSVLARAHADQLISAFAALDPEPIVTDVRAPETGLVMVRGRIGGSGRQFNLGEATVTRATIRLASGTAGYSHVLGRDRRHAWLAAIFDALWQDDPGRVRTLLGTIRDASSATDRRVAEETAATRVDFFTLVRGEDA